MNKPANRCGCTYIGHFCKREELAEVAKVCLLYSKMDYDFVCNFVCEIASRDTVKNINNRLIRKYNKIEVV